MIQNLLVSTSIRNWEEQNERLLHLVADLSDAQLNGEIAPSKNTGIYLIGHLAAVNHNLMVLFGLGENPQPEFDRIFLIDPDKAVNHTHTVTNLKEILAKSIEALDEKLKLFTEADWLDRHNNVSAEDFKTQPQRNKINVLINRTLHLAYHLGQLSLLKQKIN